MFIAWRSLATDRDAHDGIKQVVADLKITSRPQRGSSSIEYLAARAGASGLSPWSEAVRCLLGGLFKVKVSVLGLLIAVVGAFKLLLLAFTLFMLAVVSDWAGGVITFVKLKESFVRSVREAQAGRCFGSILTIF